MATPTTIVADAATLSALLHVVANEQPNLADIEAQGRVTWLLHLAVTLAEGRRRRIEKSKVSASDSEGGAA